eukprot:878760-Pyramimonas_sp.AAC.1
MYTGQRACLLFLRVDDVAMAFDVEGSGDYCQRVIAQLKAQVELRDWSELQDTPEGATYLHREGFKLNQDYAIPIDMDEHVGGVTDYRMPRERAEKKGQLTRSEHRALRDMGGQ